MISTFITRRFVSSALELLLRYISLVLPGSISLCNIRDSFPRPQLVESLSHKFVVRIAAGISFCACVTDAGEVYNWYLSTLGIAG